MRAQVGSIWTRDGTTYEVIGFTSDDKIRVRAVEYPASQVVAYHYEDFHRNFMKIKSAPTVESLVVPGSVWKSLVNVRRYEVISVMSGFVRFQSKHTSSVTGKPYKYTYDMPRFLRTMHPIEVKPEPAPDKWAEVERTLRLYNAANREHTRLENAVTVAGEAVHMARLAVEDHRKARDIAAAAYGDALRVMEDSVK